jgi:hypothetical protein
MHRQSILSTLIAILVLASPSPGFAAAPYGELGIGMPELAKLRVGALLHPRVSAELYGSAVLFNALVGIGATGYLLGEARENLPPKNALAVQGTVAFNPTLSPLRVRSGAETIASAALANVGYAYTADSGFLFRAWFGGILLVEDGPGGGPNFSVGVGWIFGAP